MSRSTRVGVVLVVMVVLAGCNGLPSGGDGTPARTLTPMDVPTDEPTPTPLPELAPGLTRDGVDDPFVLGDAHASVLAETSYTLHRNLTVRNMSGRIYRHATTDARLAANESRYYIVRNGSQTSHSSPVVEEAFWSNGNRTLIARRTTDDTTYTIARDGAQPIPLRQVISLDPTNSEQIATLFSGGETRVVGQTIRNGTRLYYVRGTNLTSEFALDNQWQNPGNVTLIALVDPRGLVHEYHLRYVASLNGDPVRISRRVRYTDIGATTVERPPWYKTAIENTTPTTPTTTATAATPTTTPTASG